MATLEREKKLSISIYNYPEHLNPFSEEDNVGKLHFWNKGPKKSRSNSFSFSGFKDLRNTWSFKSFTKKGRRELQDKAERTSSSTTNSPIVYRKALNGNSSSTQTLNRVTTGSQPQATRYVYSGSVTPLPRSRIHERGTIANTPQNEYLSPDSLSRRTSSPSGPMEHSLPSLNELKVENHGSQTSLQSNNTFERMGSVRASSRKKRRAPPPPPQRISSIPDTPHIIITDTSQNSVKLDTNCGDDIDIDHPSLNIELKIVEEIDEKSVNLNAAENNPKEELKDVQENTISISNANSIEMEKPVINIIVDEPENDETKETPKKETKISSSSDDSVFEYSTSREIIKEDVDFVIQKISIEDDTPTDLFQKVDIVTYKKQISEGAQEENSNNEIDASKENNENKSSLMNNNTIKSKEESEINDSANSDVQIVKCKVIDSREKYAVNLNARTEFFKTDKASDKEEKEVIITRDRKVENNNYQRRTVSDMKLIFDNPKPNDTVLSTGSNNSSPNPIPKPRRTRLESKMSVSSESYKAESPCSDADEKVSLKL